MVVLGISAFYHDSAAVLIKDGKILWAAEEERFTRVKHDNRFPSHAIEFCLKSAGIKPEDLDAIAYYEKPLLKFERILEQIVKAYPFSIKPFVKGVPEWISSKIKIEYIIRNNLKYKRKIYFIPHHFSHAAASFYTSGFKNAAILTVDGVGEYQTTGLWFGSENKLSSLKYINFPDSLGLLYSTFTAFLGFKVNEDEYKVMGLASYGKPIFIDQIYKIIDIKADGSFKLNIKYFSFQEGFRMWSSDFQNLFGVPRLPNKKITKRDKDLAASIQFVTEKVYFKMINHLYFLTKCKNLCIGGGVALNALANGKIYSNTPFKKVYVFGAAGDNGAALGAALFVGLNILKAKKRYLVDLLSLGSDYKNLEIGRDLRKHEINFKRFKTEDELIKKTARLLVNNAIIGWFQGKMEFGPRALGNRSILANPSHLWMKDSVNRIKIREKFRPFAGSVLQDKVTSLFKIPSKNHSYPFMTFCFPVKEGEKDKLSAIVHRDGTCRIQTVDRRSGRYYKLISEFYKLSGIPCVLNTSFNLKGEPIVENPDQAINDFLKTKMDYLVIGNFLVSKVFDKG